MKELSRAIMQYGKMSRENGKKHGAIIRPPKYAQANREFDVQRTFPFTANQEKGGKRSVLVMIKRFLDVILAIVSIILSLPLLPFIAFFIKLDSKGPVFYRCERIGKGGKPFRMFKFRTMHETPVRVGTSVSPQGDVRVTDFGRFLRRTKLNELPQFFNILKGEMSFVGPRPEAPDLAALYSPEAQILFSVKPGLVGPAQILNRNEDELYPDGVDPKVYYIRHILPDKLKVDNEYISNPTLLNDLKYILLAIKETIFGAFSRRHFFENRSQIYLFLFDLALIFVSYILAAELRFEGKIPVADRSVLIDTFRILLVYRLICFVAFGLYGTLLRYMNFDSYKAVTKAVTLSALLTAATVYIFGYQTPRSLLLIDWFCLNTFMISVRAPSKLLRSKMHKTRKQEKKRVLIFGAGDKGNLAALHLKDSVEITGFLDDDHAKRNKRTQQYQVMGNRYDIIPLARIYHIDEVIIAVCNLDERTLNHIISLCQQAGVGYSIFTTLIDSYTDRMRGEHLHEKKLSQWVGSHELRMDWAQLESTFAGKRFLLIGPSNTLGLELLKCLSHVDSGEIVLLDRYESYLNETFARAMTFIPKERVRPCLSSDPLPITAEKILSASRPPSIVVHMGTRKYPSSLQTDPLIIAKDNILNTWDLFQTVRRAGCELGVMVSSIGATKPTNFIQATLRLAEEYLQSMFANSTTTRIAIVRLYNIVENHGSVLRLIQNQLRDGRTVLLNHPEEKRYFLTASSAAQLILLSAALATQDHAGIYVPNINGTVKVLKIAKLIIQDYGLQPYRDVKIEYSGSGNPAAWKDEVYLNGHELCETVHENIKRIIPSPDFSMHQVNDDIEEFRLLVAKADREGLVKKVKGLIQKSHAAACNENDKDLVFV